MHKTKHHKTGPKLYIFCAIFTLFTACSLLHAATYKDTARFFVSQTAKQFVDVFFSSKSPTSLYDLTLSTPAVSPKTFYRTVFDYRNVFTQYKPKRFKASAQLIKTVDTSPDSANCYFIVSLKTKGLFGRVKSLYAVKLTCVRQNSQWFVSINPEVNPELPELFETLYSKLITDRTQIKNAQIMAARVIDADSSKQFTQHEQVATLLNEGRVLYRLGQFSSALEAFEKVLSVEKNPEASLSVKQCKLALDKEQEKVYQANRQLQQMDEKIRILEAEKQSHKQDKNRIEKKLSEEIKDLKKQIAQIRQQNKTSARKATDQSVSQQISTSAQELFNAGLYRKAAVQARKALSIEPENKTAQRLLELSKKAITLESKAS